jgi:hypothetical protein
VIDRVVLNTKIELDTMKFDKRKFRPRKYTMPANDAHGNKLEIERIVYVSNSDNVSIRYNPDTNKLNVEGRLINYFSSNNLVATLGTAEMGSLFSETTITEEEYIQKEYCYDYDIDDNLIPLDEHFNPITENAIHYNTIVTEEVWEENLDTVINDINQRIFNLTGNKLDIRNFRVVHLDACFNISTEYFNEYLIIFNEIFKFQDLSTRYTNFAIENNEPLYSSFYVKPNATYRDNSNTNYVVNFYNKIDQLTNIKNSNSGKQKVTDEDINIANNVLRLEVKTGYKFLKTFCSDNGICMEQRPFKDFLNVNLCAKIIELIYARFIDKTGKLDFYSYHLAKEKVIAEGLKNEKDVLNFLQSIAKGHKNSFKDKRTFKKYQNIISELGIHYFLIPKYLNVDYLPSPMSLLQNEVETTVEMKNFFDKVVLNGESFNFDDYSESTLTKLNSKYNLESIH